MFTEFNPEIEQLSTQDPPKQMSAYLEKHFNKNLRENEADAILEDYPMPNCPAIEVPRLDEEVEKQLKRARVEILILNKRKHYLISKRSSSRLVATYLLVGEHHEPRGRG